MNRTNIFLEKVEQPRRRMIDFRIQNIGKYKWEYKKIMSMKNIHENEERRSNFERVTKVWHLDKTRNRNELFLRCCISTKIVEYLPNYDTSQPTQISKVVGGLLYFKESTTLVLFYSDYQTYYQRSNIRKGYLPKLIPRVSLQVIPWHKFA